MLKWEWVSKQHRNMSHGLCAHGRHFYHIHKYKFVRLDDYHSDGFGYSGYVIEIISYNKMFRRTCWAPNSTVAKKMCELIDVARVNNKPPSVK